ncbi:MAG: DUF502 domain-containing protein, partial [Thermodesulfobacteriota bacterium]
FWSLFVKGFLTILPLAVTLYIIFWIIGSAEALVGGLFILILPDAWYIPGMGILGGVVILIGLGLMMEKKGVQRAVSRYGERLMESIPVVKTLYGSMKNLVNFFSMASDEGKGAEKVVLVTLADNIRLVGFLTGDAQKQLGITPDDGDNVAVYIPMSYQIGGFTVYIPRSRIEPLDMSFEDATKLVLTAGVGSKQVS